MPHFVAGFGPPACSQNAAAHDDSLNDRAAIFREQPNQELIEAHALDLGPGCEFDRRAWRRRRQRIGSSSSRSNRPLRSLFLVACRSAFDGIISLGFGGLGRLLGPGVSRAGFTVWRSARQRGHCRSLPLFAGRIRLAVAGLPGGLAGTVKSPGFTVGGVSPAGLPPGGVDSKGSFGRSGRLGNCGVVMGPDGSGGFVSAIR